MNKYEVVKLLNKKKYKTKTNNILDSIPSSDNKKLKEKKPRQQEEPIKIVVWNKIMCWSSFIIAKKRLCRKNIHTIETKRKVKNTPGKKKKKNPPKNNSLLQ